MTEWMREVAGPLNTEQQLILDGLAAILGRLDLAYLREIEVDPREYLPGDVYRDPVTSLPDDITINLKPIKERLRKQLDQ